MLNWIHFRNPIYPIQLNVGNVQIFQGPISAIGYEASVPATLVRAPVWRQLIYSFFEIHVTEYSHSMRWGGFGKSFTWCIFPIFFLVLMILLLKRKNIPLQRLLLLGLTATMLTPMFYWTRYILFFPGICLVAVAWAMSQKKFAIPLMLVLTIFSILFWTNSFLPIGYTSEHNRISIIQSSPKKCMNCADFLLRFNRHSCRFTSDLQAIQQELARYKRPISVFMTSGRYVIPSFPLTGLESRIRLTIICRNGCHKPVPIRTFSFFIYPHTIRAKLRLDNVQVLFKGRHLEMVRLEPGRISYNDGILHYSPIRD